MSLLHLYGIRIGNQKNYMINYFQLEFSVGWKKNTKYYWRFFTLLYAGYLKSIFCYISFLSKILYKPTELGNMCR
jgi:hypothetical protein